MVSGADRSALAGDPRFFQRAGPHSLAAVVDAAGAEAPPRRLMLHRIAPLATATADAVSFCLNVRKNLAALFQPMPPVTPGIHPSAVVAATARIDPTAEIGPLTVIGDNAVVGARSR